MFYLFNLSTNLAFIEVEHFTYPNLRLVGLLFFPNRDLIGLISYLLINFWSSKVSCGIKAVVYNKRGDCFSLLLIAFAENHSIAAGINSFCFRFINLFNGLIILPLFGLIISSLLVSMLLSFTTHESLIILLSFVIYPFMPTYYRIRTSFFPFMFSGVGSLTFILAPLFPVLGD